jgi:methyl-accepting chemotaxis protein
MSDVAELRELAQHVRELAVQTRGCAGEMRDAQSVEFVSKAADRYREDLRHEANGADSAANELDDAARALMDHAHHVEQNLARIHAIEHWFGDRLRDAQHEISQAADTVTDTARDLVDLARHAPVPGSPDWLDFGRGWLP